MSIGMDDPRSLGKKAQEIVDSFKLEDVINHIENNREKIQDLMCHTNQTYANLHKFLSKEGILKQLECIFVERGTRGGGIYFYYYHEEPFLDKIDGKDSVHLVGVFVNGDDELDYRTKEGHKD